MAAAAHLSGALAGTGSGAAARGSGPVAPVGVPVVPGPVAPVVPGGVSSGEGLTAGSGGGGHGSAPAFLIAAVLLTAGGALRRLAGRVPCPVSVLLPHEVPG
jgi:hypothetical protein